MANEIKSLEIDELYEQEIRKLIQAKLENKITSFPYRFWKGKKGKWHSKIAIKYLIEEHLKIKINEIPTKVTAKTFHKAGLARALSEFFESSYFKAIDFTYPGKFKPWQFTKGMTGIWDGEDGLERAREAIRNLIEILKINEEEIPKRIGYQTFRDYGLGGMLQTLYNSSPYFAIESVLPGKFKPWEFHVKNYWLDKTYTEAQIAIKWLVEEKLMLKETDFASIQKKHFIQFGLGQMLKIFYGNSHIRAMIDVYPDFLKSRSI